MAQISMLQKVQDRLEREKGNWPSVARGAGVDYFTVVRIGSRKAKSPRYTTIEKLAKFLRVN